MALDATVSGPDSNSYVTVDEANSYHESRLHNDSWSAATQADIEAALVWATSILDQKKWKGNKATQSQSLRFPRSNLITMDNDVLASNTIPKFLKDAVSELAFYLLSEDRTSDSDTAGFTAIQVGSIKLDIDKNDRSSVLPESVKNQISFYVKNGIGGSTRKLVRT